MRYNQKYIFDELFFEKIDTAEKAYFLGFLYADGCNTSKGLTINLHKKDKEILYKFKKQIESNHPIIEKAKINQFSFIIIRQKLSQQLTKLGCVPRKSLILEWPTEEQIPRKSIPHFIRGYFDGDGCLYLGKHGAKIIIAGTKCFLTGLAQIISSEIKDKRFSLFPKKKIFYLSYHGNQIRKKIYHFIYIDSFSSKLYLKRKFDKFQTFLQNCPPVRKKSSKFKGVIKHLGKWEARIQIKSKQYYLGRFNLEIEAAKAYRKFVREFR